MVCFGHDERRSKQQGSRFLLLLSVSLYLNSPFLPHTRTYTHTFIYLSLLWPWQFFTPQQDRKLKSCLFFFPMESSIDCKYSLRTQNNDVDTSPRLDKRLEDKRKNVESSCSMETGFFFLRIQKSLQTNLFPYFWAHEKPYRGWDGSGAVWPFSCTSHLDGLLLPSLQLITANTGNGFAEAAGSTTSHVASWGAFPFQR